MCCVHFLVAVCALIAAVRADPVNKDACDQWADMALKVTGSGRLHKCTTRPQECTVMDCTGSTTFSHNMYPMFLQHDIDLTYCFGMQMNSCNDPLSMDFYLQLPSRNISKVFRITNDDAYDLKELNFSLGSFGTTYPLFNFQFERGDTKTVNLSVTARLKGSQPLADIVLEGFHFTLINDQVIPVKPCEKIIQDSNKMPPKTFAPDKCKLKSFTPASTLTPSVADKPSVTLNKTCGLDHFCAAREMCQLSLPTPTCTCSQEFFLSSKGDSCLSSSKINQSCSQNEECGYNEECRGDSPKPSTCQCKKHYVYSGDREICIIPLPGHVSEPPVTTTQSQSSTVEYHKSQQSSTVEYHKPQQSSTVEYHKPQQSSTVEYHKPEPVKAKTSDDNKHKIAVFVGGGLAGLVVFGLAIWALVCVMRRRQRPLSINDRESSAPLIGNDDNLIM